MGISSQTSHRHGFTLVELLVVIAIIGILVAMLVPAVQSVREMARRVQCASHIRQLAMATQNYQTAKSRFPSGGISTPGYDQREVSLQAMLLPYCEQSALKNQLDASTDLDGNGVIDQSDFVALARFRVPLLNCGSADSNKTNDQVLFTTHYYGIQGPADELSNGAVLYNGVSYRDYFGPSWNAVNSLEGIFAPTRYLQSGSHPDQPFNAWHYDPNQAVQTTDIPDGLSNTLLFGEISWDGSDGMQYQPWTLGPQRFGVEDTSADTNHAWNGGVKAITDRPINSNIYNGSNKLSWGSSHPAGANFVTADGSVKFLPATTDMAVLFSLGSCNSSEINTSIE